MEREIKIIISEDGEMSIGAGQYTVRELLNVGQGIINLANSIKVNFDGSKDE